jgi:hypothetical protein
MFSRSNVDIWRFVVEVIRQMTPMLWLDFSRGTCD